MDRLMIIFFALFITWFILFDQQLVTKTVASYVNLADIGDDDDVSGTTENPDLVENTTEDDDDYPDPSVIENKTPFLWDNRKDLNQHESSEDIIELNVGGQKIVTYGSTLRAVPNSKLARMFPEDHKGQTKQHEPTFFDYNPVQFQYLLDQLRALKHLPRKPSYELKFEAPKADVHFNFSDMLLELGLNPDSLLSPRDGIHLNLKRSSLIGWKQCYRGKYNADFDATILTDTCKGERLLVACSNASDKENLIVAGIGKREDIFRSCSPNSYCATEMKNGTGFYYVQNQVWGFQGRPKEFVTNIPSNNRGVPQGSVRLNPCDSSDEHSQYRLCWSLRSSLGRGSGDRCGSSKNLQNTPGWNRLIYQPA